MKIRRFDSAVHRPLIGDHIRKSTLEPGRGVDSAVEGFFLNHSDFLVKLEELTTSSRADRTGSMARRAYPLARAPVVSMR